MRSASTRASLEVPTVPTTHHVDRDRVQHLVGDDRAVNAGGQRRQPLDSRAQLIGKRLQRRPLPLAQLGAGLQDGVAGGQRAAGGQCRQQVARKPPAAGPELDDLAARRCAQDRLDLRRQRGAEQRRHLRRGREIAVRTELGQPRTVIAEAGRI
jgi:hypothetical protein